MRPQILPKTIHISIIIIGIFLFCTCAKAQQSFSKPDWSAFQFLLGEWAGEGSGDPGQGTGIFTFSMDLQDHIILRRNRSDYPATETHPAFSHNDLMIIYQEPGTSARAIYFDNENHTIEYNISAKGKSIVFTSDSLRGGPRFRLTYTLLSGDSLFLTFEIAPPATPNIFKTYIEGRAFRTNSDPAIHTEKEKK
jgi:hypothetical protein